MAEGIIRVIRAVPNAPTLVPILRLFEKKGEGMVTCFPDGMLASLRDALGTSSHLDFIEWSTLVHQVALLSGEEIKGLAANTLVEAAVSFSFYDLESDSPYANSKTHVGAHRSVHRMIQHLHQWGWTGEKLQDIAPTFGSPLREKLRSLASIEKNKVRRLSRLGRQTHTDHMRLCLDSVPELDGFVDRLLIFAGDAVTPLQDLWIRWLNSFGVSITIVIDDHPHARGLFSRVREWSKTLPVEAVGSTHVLAGNLFADSPVEGLSLVDSVIEVSADPLSESEWALRRAAKVVEGGQSATIVARQIGMYAPLLECASRRLGIPIRLIRSAPLLTNSFARLTLAALRFCSGQDVRVLSPLLTSSYLMLEGSRQAELRTVLFDAYSQRENQWAALKTWSNENVDRFPWLEMLLEWRGRALERGHTQREWFVLVNELLRADDRLPWSVSVSEGDPQLRMRDVFARNQMERCLVNEISVAQLEDPRDVPFESFVNWCEKIWGATDVMIPPAETGIPVVSSSQAFLGSDVVFVLGMLEGSFPRRRRENSTLFDDDLMALSDAQPELQSIFDSHDIALGERLEFFRLCAKADRQIVFSYPTASDESDSIPAFYLEAVRNILQPLGKIEDVTHPRTQWSPPEPELAADRLLSDSISGPTPPPLDNSLNLPAAVSLMADAPAAGYLPQELADVLECPFHFLGRHRLKLRPRRSIVRWSLLRSIPADIGLTAITDLGVARRLMQHQLQAKLNDLYSELPPWESKFLTQGGSRLIERWLTREGVRRDLWVARLGPEVFRAVQFGEHETRSSVKGVHIRGGFGAIYELGSYRVGQLYEGPQPSEEFQKFGLSPRDHLWIGLSFAALSTGLRDLALDIEGMGPRRSVLLIPAKSPTSENAGWIPPQDTEAGLHVVRMEEQDLLNGTSNMFKTRTIAYLNEAMKVIGEAKPLPKPGEHCGSCHYGELCRKSIEFVEEEALFEESTDVS